MVSGTRTSPEKGFSEQNLEFNAAFTRIQLKYVPIPTENLNGLAPRLCSKLVFALILSYLGANS